MRFVFISSMSGYPWGGSEELWNQAALQLPINLAHPHPATEPADRGR
jgi:hypothetical protein